MDISTEIEAYVRGYKGSSREPSDHPFEASTWIMFMAESININYPCTKGKAAVFAKWGREHHRPEGFSFHISGDDETLILERINQQFINFSGKSLFLPTAPKIRELDF